MAAKYKKGPRGWETQVWDGTYNSNGTKHRIHLYSDKSSRDLEAKVAEYRRKVRDGNIELPADISFLDYSRHWLEVKKGVREKNTKRMYSHVIEKFFFDLEGIRLSDLRHSQIQGLINANMDRPRSCEEIALTIKQVLKMAVDDSYITRDKYHKLVDNLAVPKYKAPEKRALSREEKDALKTAAFTDREKAFVYMIYYCGLRRGEALALTPFDFSFKDSGSFVTITKALIFVGNNSEVKSTPKTERSNRTVPIPEEAAAFLKKYVREIKGTYLFSNLRERDKITLTGYNKMWAGIIDKMNIAAGGSDRFPVISGLTAHIFRHNYCTNLCYQIPTVSIKKIAALLGDTDKMVLNVYNHIMEEKEDPLVAITEALAL